jgi:hippurate hydrolase
MDALPVEENTGLPFASAVKGVMHACGHDIHMSAWAGTAKLMASNRARWSGTLMMVAQLAEEGSGGARAMLGDGLFTRVPKPDFAQSQHDDDTMPAGRIGYHAGPFRAGSDRVRITIHGRGGHAAMPHRTVDPVVIAGHVIVRLQTIVSRETNPLEPVVVTIGSIHGGSRENIIPGEVEMLVSVRTYSSESRERVLGAIERMVRGEAAAAGAPNQPEIEVRQNAPPVHNDPELTARLAPALRKALGEGNVMEMPAKMTSEDFAEYGRAGARSALLHIGAVDAAKLEAAAKSGAPVAAPHSAEWAPEREPTLKGAMRAEVAALLELLGKR